MPGSRALYLAATLDLKARPLTISPGQPLQLRYGVALWDGSATTATIEKLYRRWLEG